ncbi:hypothetical protein PM082_022279 [Marasmius tenuissimus]|nr:hypothetical protein PM082_022279 [Marasmius tenuissimus]
MARPGSTKERQCRREALSVARDQQALHTGLCWRSEQTQKTWAEGGAMRDVD